MKTSLIKSLVVNGSTDDLINPADGGQAQVFHEEETGIQTGSKAPESVRLSHARSGSKYPDPPDILEIIQAVGHFGKDPGWSHS